jgi:hypothetical protein
MTNIKNEAENVLDNMSKRVIDYRLSNLTSMGIKKDTIELITNLTYGFSKNNIAQLDTNNPVVYGIGMYEFIKDTFLQWGIAKKTVDYISIKEHFDDVIKGHIIGDFYDFREYFVDFMLGNKDKIEKGEWV